jgi:hypothetical protein
MTLYTASIFKIFFRNSVLMDIKIKFYNQKQILLNFLWFAQHLFLIHVIQLIIETEIRQNTQMRRKYESKTLHVKSLSS